MVLTQSSFCLYLFLSFFHSFSTFSDISLLLCYSYFIQLFINSNFQFGVGVYGGGTSFALLLYPLYHHHLEVHGSKPHLQPLLRCSPLLSLLCGIQIFCNLVWVSSSIFRDILDVTANDTTVHKVPGLTSCPAVSSVAVATAVGGQRWNREVSWALWQPVSNLLSFFLVLSCLWSCM